MFDLKVKRVIFNSHYGNNKESMLNVKQDLLINPKYRLYFSFPKHLENQGIEFINRLKNHSTVYNLYMGRNEFPVNYEFKGYFKNVDSVSLNSKNSKEFFKEKQKIYGILNKNIVVNPKLKKTKERKLSLFNRNIKEEIRILASHFEYLINEYPVKRYNFTQFEYMPLSFYSMGEKEDCYFDNFELKDKNNLKLYNIGENKWISLI